MAGPRSSRSRRSWHRLVEHYTPDGALGRLLLAVATGSVGAAALFVGAAFAASAVPFWPVYALLGAAVGLSGVGLALVVLWPVYLSLIGNVESASAYPAGSATGPSAGTGAVGDVDAGADADDPDEAVALLKRRYAAGKVSDEEFERRLDGLLAVDGVLDRLSRERDLESERN